MKNLIAILVMITAATCANELFAQGGFRVDVAPVSVSDSTTAGARWTFRLQQKNVLLRWRCEPFMAKHSSSIRTDSVLTTEIVGGQGFLSVSPMKAIAQTKVGTGSADAIIQMTMSGTGKVDVMTTVSIDASFAMAGEHSTLVELTFTSN